MGIASKIFNNKNGIPTFTEIFYLRFLRFSCIDTLSESFQTTPPVIPRATSPPN